MKGSKPPKCNLNKSEQKAKKELAKNKSIIILPANKGKATVVMDTTEYEAKINKMLSDERTYEKLISDPTNKYTRELKTILKRLYAVCRLLREFLLFGVSAITNEIFVQPYELDHFMYTKSQICTTLNRSYLL